MIPVPKTLTEGTDCYRLFMALRDGEVHDHHELYRLRMIVHSRKSDLVHKHDCEIDCWSRGGTSYYQLKGVVRQPDATGGSPGERRAIGQSTTAVLLSPLTAADEGKAGGGTSESRPRQPTLWEAA